MSSGSLIRIIFSLYKLSGSGSDIASINA